MKNNFTAAFFKSNRDRLRSRTDTAALTIITANGLLQRNGDSTYPFRQDSNFWYLTGIEEPDVLLVMDGSEEYLILPSRDSSREAFDGVLGADELGAISGISVVLDEVDGWDRLSMRLSEVEQVATLTPAASYIKAHGIYTNPARKHLIKRLNSKNEKLKILDIRPELTAMRMVKQPQEISAIQSAIDATVSSFELVREKLAELKYEYEIEALMTGNMRKQGVHHAYTPIVASGSNACVLHYLKNSDPVVAGDLVLLDVGAEVQGYAADISRTFSTAKPTKRQSAVWAAVIDVQDFAKQLLKPGVLVGVYEKEVEIYMGKKLNELGIIKGLESTQIRKYYPHATSHFLGLDVHDAADYEKPLEPGMVLTVEPGIYIPEEKIGIRIEDDFLITESGAQSLSSKLQRDL